MSSGTNMMECGQQPTILIAAIAVFGEPICDVMKGLTVLPMRGLTGMKVLYQITVFTQFILEENN